MTSAAAERALDLLAENATEGLGPRRLDELDQLLGSVSRNEQDELGLDREGFELAAAAIELAYTDVEPMPESLKQRLARQSADALGLAAETREDVEASNVVRFPTPPQEVAASSGLSPWLGWMAAAAALVLAVLSWLPERQPAEQIAELTEITEITPAGARELLLAEAQDVIRLDWTATEDPAAATASGDVVWSGTRQEGYMLFRGLEVNDPEAWQYQLWIFDSAQDERYPIDGGVFDVTDSGEVVVSIDPKLRVSEATLFAITVEKPGGVVVSSRERLPLLAKVA